MLFQLESDDGKLSRVAVVGDLAPDRPDAGPLRDTFGDDIYRKLVLLNMEQSPFVNSPGLGWLLMNQRKFRETGGRCVLHSIPPAVLQAMKLMQLDRRLTIAADSAEAARLALEEKQ